MSTILKTVFVIIALSSASFLFAQPQKENLREKLKSSSFNQKFDVALNLEYDKVFIDALYIWQILLEDDPSNANLHYKVGMCYIYLNKEVEAFPYLDRAQYSVTKNYNSILSTERNAPTELFYYLAKSNHVKGSVDSAYNQYTFFLETVNKKHVKYDLGVLGQMQCNNARNLIANPKAYTIKNLGSEINGIGPDYSPVITIDGSTLFYTSKRLRSDSTNFEQMSIENGQYYEDIYATYKDKDGKWTTPNYLDFCRPRRNDASISSSPDGQMVFVYQDVNGGDIYYSELVDTTFKNILPFPAAELNTPYWESHATISNDGEYLYFVSDRPGGYGGRDIYRLRKLPNGEWSKAMNLGPTINGKYDEESPFLGVDSKTMYFSSNGKRSMGGFDIFVTQIDEDEVWSEPINMGYPLNTVDDDIFYTTTADGRTGYYSSEKLNGLGDKDIYSVYGDNDYIQNIAVLKGYILMSDNSRIPSSARIEVSDLTEGSSPQKYAPRMRDGGYVLTLKPCHTYKLDYYIDTAVFYTQELYVPCNSSYQELNHELLLDLVSFNVKRIISEEDSIALVERLQEMTCNLVYKIQIGAFKNDIPANYYKKYTPITTEILDKKITRYMLGAFDEYNLAEAVKREVLDKYPDAFIVAYLNAVRIQTSTARDIENGVLKCNENEYPTEVFRQDSVTNFTALIDAPNFEYHFQYNKDVFNDKNPKFRKFVQGIKEITDKDLPVTIFITASASKVPTKSFKDNQDLAIHRMDNGKKTVLNLLREFNVDMTKINIVLKEASVNGPEYQNDAKENESFYQGYQYIKFEIQF